MSKLKDKYIQMAENRDDYNYINNSNFLLPDMDEMISEDLMAEIHEQYVNGDTDGKYNDKEILDSTFYTEEPFSLTPGYYPEEGAFVLKVNYFNPTEDKWILNKFDGDTVSFALSDIDDGNDPVILSKHDKSTFTYKNFKEFFKKMGGGNSIQIRSIGIDAAEIPHFEIQPVLKSSIDKRVKTMTFKEMLALRNHNTTVLYELCPYYIDPKTKTKKVHQRKDDDIVKLLLVSDSNGKKQYTEIIERSELNPVSLYTAGGGTIKSNYEYYVVIGQDESESNKIEDGIKAQGAIKKVLTEASEIMLVINANGISADKNPTTTTKSFNSVFYMDDIIKYLVEEWDTYYGNLPVTNYSYVPYGMDAYKRSLGVIYAKYQGRWINVNKYVLCNTEMTIANPNFNDSPELQDIGAGISDSFNLWSYDRNNIEWLDSFDKIANKSYQERLELHKKLTGIDFTQVRDCALMIGDTLMLIPPESIRNVTQLSYERVPTMRSKGTMAKDKDNAQQLLEITLYFYEEAGINGIDYVYTSPNGTTFTYKMNGLRSLIAQFKIAPYLPIENGYINDILGIEAVALQNMNISNVEGYPRLMKVVLTLQEFNYRMFMPDMPIDDEEQEGSIAEMNPMFAKAFNWEIFRYYYQRALMAGDELAEIETNGGYATYDYNLKYYQNKNAIGPWIFCGPLSTKGEISFYIPDEDWLNSALQVKKNRDSSYLTPESGITLSDRAKAYITSLAKLANSIKKIKAGGNNEFNKALDNFIGKAVRKEIEVGVSAPFFLGDGKTFETIDRTGETCITVSGTDNPVSLDSLEIRDKYIIPLKNAFFNAVNDATVLTNVSINESIYKDIDNIYYVNWDFCITLNLQSITDDDYRDIREIISKRLDIKLEEVFKDGMVKISYKMAFENKNFAKDKLIIGNSTEAVPYVSTFVPITTTDEQGLNNLIAHIDESNEDEIFEITNDGINEYNEQIDFYVKDYKNPANMPYKPYLQGVLCTNMMGNIANSFTDVNIKAIEGKAPQYMGGQDTQLQFELITDDITVVGALNALPVLASAMAKKYRRILPAWPIKIHSDLTRVLGVSEVLIDMMEVNTVEGFPGIYSIVMRLTSVDRTQRQKEALRRLDVAPQGGKVGYNHNSDLSMKNYFALDNTLAQVELYPDLDLPSLQELGQLGFRYIKYSGKNRSYPDPDFYIVYNYPYTSLIIKKMVKDVLSKNLLNPEGDESLHSFKFKDIMGAELTGKVEAYTGISLSSLDNTQAKTYSDIVQNLEQTIYSKLENNKSLTTEDKEEIVDKLELTAALKKLVLADLSDGWEVRPAWRAPLAEKNVDKAIREYINGKSNIYAKEIKERRKKAIELIDKILANPLKYRDDDDFIWFNNEENAYKIICERAVNNMFTKGDGLELLKLLCPGVTSFAEAGLGINNTFMKSYFNYETPIEYLVGFLFASGCALSADKEYASKVKKKDWYPNQYITSLNVPTRDTDENSEYYDRALPYCISDKIEGSSKMITTIKDGIANGTVFGAWRITKYSDPQLIANMVEKESEIKYTKNDSVYKTINPGFLDPYYNKLSDKSEDLLNYKKSLLLSTQSNAEAFLRLVLLSLRKMICDGLLISELDILALDFSDLYSNIIDTEEDKANSDHVGSDQTIGYSNNGSRAKKDKSDITALLEELGLNQEEMKELLTSIKKSAARSFCVRLIYPFLITTVESNSDIMSIIKNRDYNSLNALTSYVEYGSGTTESKTKVIKFLAALSGINLSLEKSGKNDTTISESQKLMNSLIKDVFIQASEDPRAYLVHSFYDMLVNDKRGRLVRAFPTYYVVFIDEGRKIGSWKLHDNFYNMNSIASISVVKSRKIATDTCNIVMNNMFNSYTMEPDSTTTQQYMDIYGLRDVFDSIFSPRTYFDKEKRIRLRKTIPDTVVLQPGIRIHVRMGYGSDGSKLPVVFNGKVAEVNVNEVAEIVAQGDGHELMNPLNAFGEIEALSLDASMSDITWFKDIRGSLSKGGETPRDLLAKILTAKYGGWRKQLDGIMDGRVFNDNPFGIMHFGDPKFINIFEQGELVQNLYEVSDSSLLKGINEFTTTATGKKVTPTINTSIQDKTFWDLLHLCANSGINYIGAIRDFGFRSTVFLGKPNHYYAYAYELLDNKIVEKRKPFQQFHYFDSYTDIVYNSIKASESQMKTNAVGMWQCSSPWWGREQSTVGPIYLDMNIYPEYQKAMTVDTGLLAAGNGGIDIGILTHHSEKWSTDVNDDKVNKALAWRITANALKNSVKDMYQGDICIVGDPSVKPYDRVYIHDVYEDMQGMFEVEAVIHNMSNETGFTTSIMPDVIARHEDSFEASTQSLMSVAGGMLGLGVGGIMIDKLWGSAVHGKLTTVVAKSNSATGMTNKLAGIANDLYNATGMKDYLENKPVAKEIFSKLNILPDVNSVNLNSIELAINTLEKININDLNKYDDIAKAFLSFSNLDMDKYEKALITAYNNNKYGAAKANYSLEDLQKEIEKIKIAKAKLDENINFSKFDIKGFADEIFKVTVDDLPLNKATSIEVSNILNKWKTGKLDDTMGAAEQIAKVMNDPEILKAINNKSLKVDKIDDFFKGFKDIFKTVDVDGKSVSLFASLAKTLRGGDILSDLSKVLKGLLKSNWIGLLIDLALETTVFVMTKNAQEVFTRFLQSIQAVDVYPLKKYNKPLIAGMNGHKGSVYGYPVKEGYDSIQGMIMSFAEMFKKLDGGSGGHGLADWLLGLFVDRGVLENLSAEWRAELGIESVNEMDKEEEIAQATYNSISSMYAANNKQAYSLMTIPRVAVKQLSDENAESLLSLYQITKVMPLSIPTNENILDLNYLLSNPTIRKAVVNDRFEIAHSDKYDYIYTIPFESGSVNVPVKVKDGIIDMPLVKDELIMILEHVLTVDSLKDYKIHFKSGTRVNDIEGAWKSTGYSMILESNTSGAKALETVLNEYKEITNIIKDSDGVFHFVRNGDKVVITALPPKEKQN